MTSIAAVRRMPFNQKNLTHQQAKNIARLTRLIRDMGINLEWRDLGEQRRGEYHDGDSGRYYDGRSTIVMNIKLRGFQVAYTLGHEIAHAMFGDRQSNAITEERATRIGAALAIDPANFRRERIHPMPGNRLRRLGMTQTGLTALEATPHAESGCPCDSCQRIRDEILREMEGLRASVRAIKEAYATAMGRPADEDDDARAASPGR